MSTIPVETYAALQAAFDHFNERLFDGALSPVQFVFARKKGARGYYWQEKWVREGGEKAGGFGEIALNPDAIAGEHPRRTASTLVHEMAHHWQKLLGTPGQNGYHNREWATMMRALGLPPQSATTGPEGTGTKVTHDIEDGGAFDLAWQELGNWALGWKGHNTRTPEQNKRAKQQRKHKYSCPDCGATVWGKADMHIVCGECEADFEEVGGEDG